jgi:hypothetical protein
MVSTRAAGYTGTPEGPASSIGKVWAVRPCPAQGQPTARYVNGGSCGSRRVGPQDAPEGCPSASRRSEVFATGSAVAASKAASCAGNPKTRSRSPGRRTVFWMRCVFPSQPGRDDAASQSPRQRVLSGSKTVQEPNRRSLKRTPAGTSSRRCDRISGWLLPIRHGRPRNPGRGEAPAGNSPAPWRDPPASGTSSPDHCEGRANWGGL